MDLDMDTTTTTSTTTANNNNSSSNINDNTNSPINNINKNNNNIMSSSSNGQAFATPDTTKLKSSYDINVIRLIGQHLDSLGLKKTVDLLLRETGVPSLDHPLADRIQRHILTGQFDEASSLVDDLADLVIMSTQEQDQQKQQQMLQYRKRLYHFDANTAPQQKQKSKQHTNHQDQKIASKNTTSNAASNKEPQQTNCITPPLGSDKQQMVNSMRMAIAEQKYLELLEDKERMLALKCLQSEITPAANKEDLDHLPFLATLLLCRSTSDLRQRACWPGKGQQSRQLVIEKLRCHVPPLLLLPAQRLNTLLNQAGQLQRDRCPFHLELDNLDNSASNDSFSLSLNENQATRSQQQPTANSNGSATDTSRTNHGNNSNSNNIKETSQNGHRASTSSSATTETTPPSTSSSSMSLDQSSSQMLTTSDQVDYLVRDHMCFVEKFPMQIKADYDSHKSEVWYCQFSHDGLKLATGGVGGKVKIWHMDPVEAKLREKCTFDCHSKSILCLSWSPDDTHLLAATHLDRSDLWLFNINKEEVQSMISPAEGEYFGTCSWHITGKRLAAASILGNFYLYDLDGNRLGAREGVRVQCLHFLNKDSKSLLAADNQNRIRVYTMESICRQNSEDRDVIEETFPIISFVVTSDDKYIAVNLQTQGVHLWDYETRTLMRVFSGVLQRTMTIFSSFSSHPGHTFLASGSEDGSVYIYHINKYDRPVVVLRGHLKCVNCVAWNPKYPEFLVSASDDRVVRLWGPRTDLLEGP